jgi:hypothetical protein
VDGEAQKHCPEVKHLTFSPDSQRLAYGARPDSRWCVNEGAKEGKHYEALGDLTFSPDSQRLAYGAKRGDDFFLVVDGKERKHYDTVILSGVGGKILFDSSHSLRYLAIVEDSVYSVKEELD